MKWRKCSIRFVKCIVFSAIENDHFHNIEWISHTTYKRWVTCGPSFDLIRISCVKLIKWSSNTQLCEGEPIAAGKNSNGIDCNGSAVNTFHLCFGLSIILSLIYSLELNNSAHFGTISLHIRIVLAYIGLSLGFGLSFIYNTVYVFIV